MLPASEARELAEIALASLNAKPVAEISEWWPLGVDGGASKLLQPTGVLPGVGSTLYTAPPVQVIKLPEKKDIEHVYHGASGAFNAGKSAGYNECIADIEVLNGIE